MPWRRCGAPVLHTHPQSTRCAIARKRASRGRLSKAPTNIIRRGANTIDLDCELLHIDTIHKVLMVRTGPIPTQESLNACASQARFESIAAQLGTTATASEPPAKLLTHASNFCQWSAHTA